MTPLETERDKAKDELIEHYEQIVLGIIERYGLRSETPRADKIKSKIASLTEQIKIINDLSGEEIEDVRTITSTEYTEQISESKGTKTILDSEICLKCIDPSECDNCAMYEAKSTTTIKIEPQSGQPKKKFNYMQIRDLTDEEWLKLPKEEILQLYKNCYKMLMDMVKSQSPSDQPVTDEEIHNFAIDYIKKLVAKDIPTDGTPIPFSEESLKQKLNFMKLGAMFMRDGDIFKWMRNSITNK